LAPKTRTLAKAKLYGWLLLTGRALSRISMPITSASQGAGVAAGCERRLPHNETDDARVVGSPPARLIFKPEVLHRVGLSFPTIWKLMQLGSFPRARIIGGKSAWIESEISDFIATLPLRRYKNDVSPDGKSERKRTLMDRKTKTSFF
jgi:predicted DNA-binding transcriptional regulator AlpA